MQFMIGDMLALSGVIAFPDNSGLAATAFKMAVNAICRYVQRAIFEPLNRHVGMFVRDVFNRFKWFYPINPFPMFGPKADWIFNRLGIKRLVAGLVDMRVFSEFSRGCVGCLGHNSGP